MCCLSARPGRTLLLDMSSRQSNLRIREREKCYPPSRAILLDLFFGNYKLQEILLSFPICTLAPLHGEKYRSKIY